MWLKLPDCLQRTQGKHVTQFAKESSSVGKLASRPAMLVSHQTDLKRNFRYDVKMNTVN